MNFLSLSCVCVDVLFSLTVLRSFNFELAFREDDKWWLLPTILLLFKTIQARFVDWHIANLEIEDYSLFCPDPDAFWAHESGS